MNLFDYMPKDGKYLEIGPLDNPLLKKTNYDVYYLDYRTTEEIKKIYKGTYADLNRIVDIDFPTGTKSYKEAVGNMKFTGVYSAHCIEHTYDVIGHLRQVNDILEEGGRYVLVIPDMSNCFDFFRSPTTFREAYGVFTGGKVNSFVADSVVNTVSYYKASDVELFWNKKISFIPNLLSELPRIEMAKKIYESDAPLSYSPSCHIWTFTYDSLLIFIRDCLRCNLLPFVVEAHEAVINKKQYDICLVLKKNTDVLTNEIMRINEIIKLQIFLEKRSGIHSPLLKALTNKNKLYLYGTGLVGRTLYHILQSNSDVNCRIEFLISDDIKAEEMDGLPASVHRLSTIRNDNDAIIIVATSNREYRDEMERNLKLNGFQENFNYFML